MQIIKLLGLVGLTYMGATYLSARAARREEEDRRRLNERIEKDRWESEGGASRSGPATQNAFPTH
jgi:threonine/homoserine/homoserine lactone efflux protein